ncbi:MAG: DedA family protein, partial [Betaproteobacteria bacterium]|nr:DedA family protein [Betaproteobacteria bacterium]
MDPSLWALFISAFVSSTILPGNSEIVLVAVLKAGGANPVAAVAVATLGNTLGGMTTYGIGRLLPSRIPEGKAIAR